MLFTRIIFITRVAGVFLPDIHQYCHPDNILHSNIHLVILIPIVVILNLVILIQIMMTMIRLTRVSCGLMVWQHWGNLKDQERPLRCEQCDYSCAQAKHLKWHTFTHTGEKLIHSGEKPFVCKQCNYSSAEASKLKRHMQTHSGEKPFLQTVQLVLHRNFK